jgi:aminoglycoside phosphotransferase (APT) family kinase protein
MSNDIGTILRIVARDIEGILVPSISSPNVQFVANSMKTLLQRVAHEISEAALGDQGTAIPTHTDWKSVIAWAETDEKARLAGEETSRESAWNQSGSGTQTSDATARGRTKKIEVAQLVVYLQNRDDYRWVEDVSINQAPGGFSKDTFLVRAQGGGRSERMVLRRDQALRPLITSVADEAEILRTLSAAHLPVPAPLWLETSPTHFGASVLATSWLNGNTDSSKWANDPANAKLVLTSAATLLAKLHSFPLTKLTTLGSGVPGSVGATPGAFAEHLRSFWKDSGPAPNPLMERVLDWLEDNAPREFARRAIVHSDFGFHNLLVSGTDVTGLLDWEFWHVGDAREDLAYSRAFVERVMPWKEFSAIYESAGGITGDLEAERFYSVLGGVRIAMGCYAIQRALQRSPELLDSKMIYVGQSFAHRFLIEAAKAAAKPWD